MSNQDSLTGYGINTTETIPPLCHRKNAIEAPTKEGTPAGFLCFDRRREYRVYTTRRKGYHYYEKGDGYAVSDKILETLIEVNMSRILFHTHEDGDVYEFGVHQYEADGEPVPDHALLDPEDPQTYVPLEECYNAWEGHYPDMFIQSWEDAAPRIYEKAWYKPG